MKKLIKSLVFIFVFLLMGLVSTMAFEAHAEDLPYLTELRGSSSTGSIAPQYGDYGTYFPEITFDTEYEIAIEGNNNMPQYYGSWLIYKEDEDRDVLVRNDAKFEENKQYSLKITLYLSNATGYRLSTSTKFYIDGEEWTGAKTSGNSSATNRSWCTITSKRYLVTAPIYEFNFDSNGGSSISSQQIKSGEKATKPTDPTREGYVFDGWYTTNSFTTKFNFSNEITSNTTIYAKWIKQYNVSFVSDNVEIDNQTVNEGTTVTKPNNPTKDGYYFDGWYLGDSKYNFNTTVNSDLTLNAKWIHLFNVNFNSNGGSTVSSQVIKDGNTVTKPTDPTWENHIFLGWYSDSELTTAYDFTQPVSSDLELYAKWVRTYTVSFNVNGGSSIESQTIIEGNSATKPTDPTNDGYLFDGWYTDSSFSTEFDFSSPITKDTTIYAKWIKTPIKEVAVTIVAPKEGENPNYNIEIVSDPENTIALGEGQTDFIWLKLPISNYDSLTSIDITSDMIMSATDTFEHGYYYFVSISINCKSHYRFTSETVATINGFEPDTKFFNFYNASYPTTGMIQYRFDIIELESIEVSGDFKTKFKYGESFNADNLIITANYNDNSTKNITEYEISGYDANKPGEQTVTVTYVEDGITKTVSFQVTVAKKPNNGGIIAAIIIISVVAIAGGATAFIIIKRKKKNVA